MSGQALQRSTAQHSSVLGCCPLSAPPTPSSFYCLPLELPACRCCLPPSPCSYYCFRVFEDRVGVCLQLPPNCGQENARCCPPGIYGPPSSTRNVTGFSCQGKDIKCSGWGGMPGK